MLTLQVVEFVGLEPGAPIIKDLCDSRSEADAGSSLGTGAAGWSFFGPFVARDITADRSTTRVGEEGSGRSKRSIDAWSHPPDRLVCNRTPLVNNPNRDPFCALNQMLGQMATGETVEPRMRSMSEDDGSAPLLLGHDEQFLGRAAVIEGRGLTTRDGGDIGARAVKRRARSTDDVLGCVSCRCGPSLLFLAQGGFDPLFPFRLLGTSTLEECGRQVWGQVCQTEAYVAPGREKVSEISKGARRGLAGIDDDQQVE